MRKSEIDLLNSIEQADPTNQMLSQPAKTSQQNFLLTYASLHFLRQGKILPTMDSALMAHSGAYSEVLLTLNYMKHCMSARVNLDDTSFRVLAMLLSWMDKLDKLKKNIQPHLLPAVLQWQPGKLPLNHYAELIVYFSYISRDVQNLLKSSVEFQADDLIQLLRVLLPQIHYNVAMSEGSRDQKDTTTHDALFYNQQIQYFVQTRTPYRSLVRTLLRAILSLDLSPKQLRDIVDLTSRYYLLFFQDKKQIAERLFMTAFSKASQAVRFSLTNELVTFFKIARKLGAEGLQLAVREKWDWVDSLVAQFKDQAVGQPKEQVSPYNPLGIQQVIQVGAGKKEIRTIEIYHQNSLFYFWLNIQNRDITMRLFYVGDFQSKVEIKKQLFTEEKLTDNAKSTFIATKRGIYMLELDNSYSWMNSKSLKFQYVVLAPYQHAPNPVWLDKLLQIGQVQNQEGNEQQSNKVEGSVREEKFAADTTQSVNKEKKSKLKKQEVQEQEQADEDEDEDEEVELQQQKPVEKPKEIPTKSTPKRDNNTKDIKEKPIEPKEKPIETKAKPIEQKEKPIETKAKPIEQKEKPIEPKEKSIETKEKQIQKKEKPINTKEKTIEAASKDKKVVQQSKIESTDDSIKSEWKQANLNLIDDTFSLLINTEDHTYEFQTNLPDRMLKRIKNCLKQSEQTQWVVNGQARQWLRQNDYRLLSKGGITLVLPANSNDKRKNGSKIE